MSPSRLPENSTVHRDDFNELSGADWHNLPQNEKVKVGELETVKNTKITGIEKEYEERWQSRVEEQKHKILNSLSQQHHKPALKPEGRQFVRQAPGSRRMPSEQQLQEMAEENVRREKRNEIERTEKKYTQAQKDLIRKALGKDRNPGRER